MPRRFRFGCLGTLLVVLLVLSVLVNLVLLAGKAGDASPNRLPKFEEKLVQKSTKEAQPGETLPKVAQISLRGVISSSVPGDLGETMVDDVKVQLQQALNDEYVKAIVLNIDSPGGEVTASDIIYRAVVQARAKKPVVVYMNALTASGGFYVACAGSHLMASETTLTGSIGVIMQTLNYRGLFDKVGLQAVTIKSGKFKDLLSGSRPVTEEELAYVQGLVNESYDRFLNIVATERKQDAATLKETLADGRVFSGKTAAEQKLIDSLGTIEDAYTKARELGAAPEAEVLRYDASFSFRRLLGALSKTPVPGGKVELALPEGMQSQLQPGRLYYLPAFAAPQ